VPRDERGGKERVFRIPLRKADFLTFLLDAAFSLVNYQMVFFGYANFAGAR
jgi:hypothetical protein